MNGIITNKEREYIYDILKEDNMREFVKDMRITMLKYNAAMNEIVTKMKILSDDFRVRYSRSPIDNIEARIKSTESIIKKMIRNNLSFTIHDMENNILDIAGIRIICPFISDIYDVIEMIQQIDDIEIIKEKDYITTPKESGYRSYHMIVKVPIHLTTGKEIVYAEIQIRTMAMDFWASLEHKIKYKYDGIIPYDIGQKLIECAETINVADNQMMELSDKVKDANEIQCSFIT